jgi:diguanylate cyclase (GGDEF)-like protein
MILHTAGRDTKQTPRQRSGLRAELIGLFEKARMPTNPEVATRIIQLVDSPDSGLTDFAKVIQTDPALAVRLLRMANSPMFAQRERVTRIERAVLVLGLRRVKTISLGFELVGHLDQIGGAPFDMKVFWQHCLLRACLGRSIADAVLSGFEEEAFLVGLLQECGVLLLAQVLGPNYTGAYGSSALSPTAFYAFEKTSCPYTHVEAIAVMASEWRLPDTIATPLASHHQHVFPDRDSPETVWLSAISYLLGTLRFCDGLVVDPSEEKLRSFPESALGLNDAAWAHVVKRAADEYGQLSTLYQDKLPEGTDVTELLSVANRQLAALANESETQLLSTQAEQEKLQKDRRVLAEALRGYREQAAIDPLTGALNRGALTEAVRRAVEENHRSRRSAGVLFVDLDDFKKLNDEHGHDVGDKVLKTAALLLAQQVGYKGSIGRYGGEEFVAVLNDLTPEATCELGERIVRAFRALDVGSLGGKGPVTCSVGAIWSDNLPVRSVEELVAAADKLMYRAKREGKNGCCFAVLRADGAADGDRPPASGRGKQVPRSADGQGKPVTENGLERMLALARSLNGQDWDSFLGIRKEERMKLVASCTLYQVNADGSCAHGEPAVLRNISTGGAAVLTGRPMNRGEGTSLELETADSKLRMRGLIAFCRHVEQDVYEVGVQFVSPGITRVVATGSTSPPSTGAPEASPPP